MVSSSSYITHWKVMNTHNKLGVLAIEIDTFHDRFSLKKLS